MCGEESEENSKEILSKMEFLKWLIPVIGIIVVNLQLVLFIIATKNIGIGFIIFDVILNAIIIYQWKVSIKQKEKIEEMKSYNTYLDEKNKCLVELNDSIRCFKHDFTNIIQAIDGYIMLNNMEALKKYFSKLLKECNHTKNLELLTLNNIKDPAVYGVLLNKYKLAEKKNINMTIDIFTEFENIGDRSYILSRIMGILLDNAIEASLDCQEKNINVQFSQSPNNERKKITIENTYNNKDVDTELIFQKEYTSKKAKGNSGIGLWKVQTILKKESKMWLETTKDVNVFRQEIEIGML